MRSSAGGKTVGTVLGALALVVVLALGAGACGGKKVNMDVFEEHPCGDPEADVAKIWNKERRNEVASGMMQNGGVSAPQTVNAIDESMERLTDNYIELRAEFCEDAFVKEELPEVEYRRKVACLDQNLQRSLTHLDTLEVGESSAAADLALLADEIRLCK